MPDRATGPTLVSVNQSELVATEAPAGPVDLLFDGRRILSFGPRDLRAVPGGVRYPWPVRLRPYLRGHTDLTLRDHLSGSILFEAPVAFDTTPGRTRVVDRSGMPLAVDKGGNVGPMFEGAREKMLPVLLDTAEQLIAAITEFGAVAFVGYGTLLGAVRNGKVIGHDNDVDLICFSRHPDPVGLLLESLALERFLRQRGWEIDRPRGSFIRVATSQGYLDVFHAFHDGERLYIDQFVWADVPVDAIVPAGTIMLEGRAIAAPRDPGRVLAGIYGPEYLTPDPSFKHRPRHELRRATRAWFGNHRYGRKEWREWATVIHPDEPAVTDLARMVAEQSAPGDTIVDLGCGHGQDSIWLARRGFRVVGTDHVPESAQRLRSSARELHLPLEGWCFSFHGAAKSLMYGALVAATTDPRSLTLIANDLLDVLPVEGRENFWQFARTALLPGGALMVSIRNDPGADHPEQPRVSNPPDPGELLAEGGSHGARVISRHDEDGRTTATIVFDR